MEEEEEACMAAVMRTPWEKDPRSCGSALCWNYPDVRLPKSQLCRPHRQHIRDGVPRLN